MRIGVTALLTDRTMGPARFAVEAEGRGFHSVYLPEHTHLPLAEARPPAAVGGVDPAAYARTLDPLTALSAAAAVTGRIRLGTGVLLVAQHDPIVLAKQLATLDHLSGGRLVLGVGYGWNRTEAADHGVDFGARRAVAHDKLHCIQALWSEDPASHQGPFATVSACHAFPKPAQRPRPPVLFGGAAGDALFRAVAELGDGWMPIGGAGVAAAAERLRAAFEAAGRDGAQARIVPFGTIPDAGKLAHLADAGATEVVLRVPGGDDATMLAALDRYVPYLAP